MTYYSYGYPRKKIWDLYQPHHSVIQYPAWSAGMKLWEFKGCTWKIRNLQTFSKISREYCQETCVRVSLKEKHSPLAKNITKAYAIFLATSALYFLVFIARLYSTKAPAPYVTPSKNLFQVAFWVSFCKFFKG